MALHFAQITTPTRIVGLLKSVRGPLWIGAGALF
jgi:hypothetical protein